MRIILGLLLSVLAIAPAQAFTVKNLSEIDQVIEVEQYGRTWQPVIAPGGVYRFYAGPARIGKPGKRLVPAEQWDEYAIWPDGLLSIQRRHKIKGGLGG